MPVRIIARRAVPAAAGGVEQQPSVGETPFRPRSPAIKPIFLAVLGAWSGHAKPDLRHHALPLMYRCLLSSDLKVMLSSAEFFIIFDVVPNGQRRRAKRERTATAVDPQTPSTETEAAAANSKPRV